MATTSLANRSASVSSEPDATSDGHVGASLCWRYARISLVNRLQDDGSSDSPPSDTTRGLVLGRSMAFAKLVVLAAALAATSFAAPTTERASPPSL